MAGDNWDPDLGGGDESSFLALHGIVGYNFAIYQVPYLVAVEPILRLGWTDPRPTSMTTRPCSRLPG